MEPILASEVCDYQPIFHRCPCNAMGEWQASNLITCQGPMEKEKHVDDYLKSHSLHTQLISKCAR